MRACYPTPKRPLTGWGRRDHPLFFNPLQKITCVLVLDPHAGCSRTRTESPTNYPGAGDVLTLKNDNVLWPATFHDKRVFKSPYFLGESLINLAVLDRNFRFFFGCWKIHLGSYGSWCSWVKIPMTTLRTKPTGLISPYKTISGWHRHISG